MENPRNTLHQLFRPEDLAIGISELSKMTNVSPRQLRYWQKKGYIQPHNHQQSGQARTYSIAMAVRVAAMGKLLEEGYTLTAAARLVDERMRPFKTLFSLLFHRYQGATEIDGRLRVDLGPFDPDPSQEIYGELVDDKPVFVLGKKTE